MDLNELCRSARQGDLTAEKQLFAVLLERFSMFVHRRVGDIADGEEVTQNVLAKIAASYKGIDFETSFAAWAYRVLENEVAMYYRSASIRRRKLAELSDHSLAQPARTPNPALKSRLLECLKKICRENSRQARILNLHYQGYSVEEICARLNLTKNGMYIILHRARTMMKTCLDTGAIR